MKSNTSLVLASVLLLMNTSAFGSGLQQSSAYHLSGNAGAVIRWSQIAALDTLAHTSSQITPTVVPPPGLGPGPRPVYIGSTPAQEAATGTSRAGATSPAGHSPDEIFSGPAALSFQALPDNNTVVPPDTYGAVGPNHIMTMLNSQVRIQNKSGSTLGTVSLSSFWSSLPSSAGTFDPRVQYDAIHGRWIATCGTNPESTATKINFAISSSNDPTGSWTFYQVPADTLETGQPAWADYPCLGFNGKWIVITANMFTVVGGSFVGARMWVIDASSVTSGGPISYKLFLTKFDVAGNVNGFTLQPCVTYGAGDTLYLVDNSGYYATNDTTFLIRLSRITGTGSSPTWSAVPNSSFSGSGLFRVSNNFNQTQIDARQLGSSTLIATNDSRLLNAVFRGGRIWCTHSGGLPGKIAPAPTRTAVFWYQLNPLVMPAPIVQSGVLDGGAGVHHFFPSIAANANGDVCLGFTRSDASRYAEAVFTGRRQTDPAGTMQSIQQLKAGESVYSKFFGGSENRWGDYSNTCVDPSDDLAFWTIQEYAAQNVGTGVNDGRWGTWWGKITPQGSLPIQIASFTAVSAGKGSVRLDWTTLSEIDNYGFEVQKSPSATDPYFDIPQSFTPGHGTTTITHAYSYTDDSAAAGEWWYRLKQIDLDGLFHYSDPAVVTVPTGIAEATIPVETVLLQNFPNPFNPVTKIKYTVGGNRAEGIGGSDVSLIVYDVLGREVAVLVNERKASGDYEVRFDGAGLSSGVYFYRLTSSQYVLTRKMLLAK